MVHEHLSMNFDVAFVKPIETDVHKSTMPFSMESLGWIRYNPYSHQQNLHLNGTECEQAIIAEMKHYHSVGGGSIVECTTHGISRKAQFLHDVSLLTGVNIIAGTGYYVAASQDSKLFVEPIEKLAEVMRTEQTEGCLEAPAIRCGLIGEIGCSYPIHSTNYKLLLKRNGLK
jgi:phosphotriesterase-related protein